MAIATVSSSKALKKTAFLRRYTQTFSLAWLPKEQTNRFSPTSTRPPNSRKSKRSKKRQVSPSPNLLCQHHHRQGKQHRSPDLGACSARRGSRIWPSWRPEQKREWWVGSIESRERSSWANSDSWLLQFRVSRPDQESIIKNQDLGFKARVCITARITIIVRRWWASWANFGFLGFLLKLFDNIISAQFLVMGLPFGPELSLSLSWLFSSYVGASIHLRWKATRHTLKKACKEISHIYKEHLNLVCKWCMILWKKGWVHWKS